MYYSAEVRIENNISKNKNTINDGDIFIKLYIVHLICNPFVVSMVNASLSLVIPIRFLWRIYEWEIVLVTMSFGNLLKEY